MVRRAANTAQDLIGPNYNRGTNMHLIPLTEEAEIDELEQLQAGTSWIIAAILGAVLIGKSPQPIKKFNIPKSWKMSEIGSLPKMTENSNYLEQIGISRNSEIHRVRVRNFTKISFSLIPSLNFYGEN